MRTQDKPKPLQYSASVNAVAFRTILNQFVNDSGENYSDEEVKKLRNEDVVRIMTERLKKAISDNFDSDKYIVIAVIHDKDSAPSKTSSVPLLSPDRIHVHIVIKIREIKGREHISTILKKLGLSSCKCESICGSWKKYTCHIKHGTWMQADKPQYKAEDFISNLTVKEIEQILDGNIHEVNFSIDTDNDAKEKYVSDLGDAYRQFLVAYYRSGDLALAEKIKAKAERKAKYDYKRSIAKAKAKQAPMP